MRRLLAVILFLIACLFIAYPSILFSSTPDTIRVLAIRVEFQTDDAKTTTGNGKFDLTKPSGLYQIDPPPHNRSYFQDHLLFLKNYFWRVSHGRVIIEGDVFPLEQDGAYQLDQPMMAYNPNTTPEANNRALANLFKDAILKADQDPTIDFSQYQSFIIFHAGVGKDIDLGFDETPQDIPSLFINSQFLQNYLGESSIIVDDSIEIPGGIIVPETESQDGFEFGLNGLLVSNFGTQLGWPDLFSPDTRRPGIGKFGLMDVGLFNGDGLLPAIPCAWTRIYAGWETPINIYYAANDEFTLHFPLSRQPERVYRVPINEDEYFLIENRYAGPLNLDSLRMELSRGRDNPANVKEVLLTYYADQVTFSDSTGVLVDVKNPDIGLSGSGALIWHIDESIIRQNLGANRINADSRHRGVDLEEADGSQDIGQEFDFLSAGAGSENGWVLDMWYAGNTAPLFKNKFDPNSVPNSRSYYNRANSHIAIYDFSRPDSIMTFRVSLNIFQQGFPRKIEPEIYGRVTSMKTTDLNFDGKGEVVLTTSKGKIIIVSSSQESFVKPDASLIIESNQNLITPPVLFDFPTASGISRKALIALADDGMVHGYLFSSDFQLDTLFNYRCESSISTPPIACMVGAEVQVYWGCTDGSLFLLVLNGNEYSVQRLYKYNEPIRFIHFWNGDGITGEVDKESLSLLVVTDSGKFYKNEQILGRKPLPLNRPAGFIPAAAVTSDGQFILYKEDFAFYGVNLDFPESGLFPFTSPLIAFPSDKLGLNFPTYIVAGKNRLFCYNSNFTLYENFPVQIYRPDKNANLKLSPLLGQFWGAGSQEAYGIVVTDPAGLIDGYGFDGERLVNFPLAVGDSIKVTPVLLDFDGDGDVEISAITQSGVFYMWDLPSSYLKWGWNQLYYDELNSNWMIVPQEFLPDEPLHINTATQLLPAEKVYNWPNPNIENFTFIRYYLGDRADVSVKIFDLAGDLIDEFPGPGEPFKDNEVRWDLTNVQSGVYLARIEANNGIKKEVRIIKIAVVK